MTVLAIDIGTSAVKAIVWNPEDGVLARGHAPVATAHPQPSYAEQDPDDWSTAVQVAIASLPLDGLTGVGLSSQRETFVCLDEGCRPLRPAILWSDGRAAGPAARWRWVQEHEPEVARRTRWLAAPKDYVLHQLVGRLVTDTTLASRTDLDPTLLPDVVAPRTIVGEFHAMPVVAGAGDRACEVLAVGAHSLAPMVSWGTTANCSVPLDSAVPAGWRASLTVDGRQLMEAGLSAAGSALGWIAKLTGVPTAELSKQAQHSPPGARGVIVLPWLGGARAPWWRSDARERILGRTSETTAGDLARAVYEGVAHDIRRALAVLPEAPRLLSLAGGGSGDQVWQQVLTGVTGLPVAVTVGADAAAIGAARLAAREQIADAHVPVEPLLLPDDQQVRIYGELGQQHDAAARAALESLA